MPSSFLIRPIVVADLPNVAHLLEQAHHQSQYPLGSLWGLEFLADELAHGIGFVLVADTQGAPVESQSQSQAQASIAAFVFLRDAIDVFEITNLATACEFQRQGVMHQLLKWVQSYCCQQGKGLWLEVHEQNLSARGLYEKLGFVLAHRRPGYYGDGGAAVLYSFDCSC